VVGTGVIEPKAHFQSKPKPSPSNPVPKANALEVDSNTKAKATSPTPLEIKTAARKIRNSRVTTKEQKRARFEEYELEESHIAQASSTYKANIKNSKTNRPEFDPTLVAEDINRLIHPQ
jgi:hypothetical protein